MRTVNEVATDAINRAQKAYARRRGQERRRGMELPAVKDRIWSCEYDSRSKDSDPSLLVLGGTSVFTDSKGVVQFVRRCVQYRVFDSGRVQRLA
jgi:hypothetical protein